MDSWAGWAGRVFLLRDPPETSAERVEKHAWALVHVDRHVGARGRGGLVSKLVSKLISKLGSKRLSKLVSKLVSNLASKLVSRLASKLVSKLVRKLVRFS